MRQVSLLLCFLFYGQEVEVEGNGSGKQRNGEKREERTRGGCFLQMEERRENWRGEEGQKCTKSSSELVGVRAQK